MANLAALQLGEHIFEVNGQLRIAIPADQMKMGKRPYAADWPAALAEEMAAYLNYVRPLLMCQSCPSPVGTPAENALWVSKFASSEESVGDVGLR